MTSSFAAKFDQEEEKKPANRVLKRLQKDNYASQGLINRNQLFHGDFENLSEEDQDKVINPKHYKLIPPEAYKKYPEGLEYIDLMEYILEPHSGVQAHLLGHCFKYACRIGKKDSTLQDAKKIAWYANRLVKVLEGD